MITWNEMDTCTGLGFESLDNTDPLNWLLETLANAVTEARKERDDPPKEIADSLTTERARQMHFNYLTGIVEGYQYAIRRVVDAMALAQGGIPGDLPYPSVSHPE
jgi:hypothetical protein